MGFPYDVWVATVWARTRSRERLERLTASTTGSEELQREVVADLRRTIGFDRWCWPSADPTTLLPGPGLAEHDDGPLLPRTLELEYSGSDVATKEQAARSGPGVVTMSLATDGDLARSPRWDDVLRGVGIGDTAIVACRDGHGCWAWLEIYRDGADAPFAVEDLELLGQLAPALGTALRRRSAVAVDGRLTDASSATAAHLPDGAEADGQAAAGVLLFDGELRLVGRTTTAQEWLATLPGAQLFASWGILEPAVYAAAVRARAGRESGARLLGRTTAGGWAQIEAARVVDSTQVAVTLRAATPQEIFRSAARMHGLSGREQDVAVHVAAGLDTAAIAHGLFISPWTVQDHLKSVFTKLGVHSRGGVMARLGGLGGEQLP